MDPMKTYHRPGTPPGTLTAAPGESGPARILVTRYDAAGCETVEVPSADAIEELDPARGMYWIHVTGLADVAAIERLGERLGLHALALEDVLNLGQRPKIDEFGDKLFVVLQHLSVEDEALVKRQIAVFIGRSTVVSFQSAGMDLLHAVRERLTRGHGRMRQRGAAYLAYAIIDLAVDSAFPALEAIGTQLDRLEDILLDRPDRGAIEDLQNVRRQLLGLRQVLWAQREIVGRMAREEYELLPEEDRIYFRDCYDHAVQALEVAETYREMASGLLDVYLSSLSHRLNDVMKVLTVLSTLFMPLAFLASVYGMNFDTSLPLNMPELHWRYGYAAFWGASLTLTATMLWVFRRRGWL